MRVGERIGPERAHRFGLALAGAARVLLQVLALAHDQAIEMLSHVGAVHEEAREQLFRMNLPLLIGRERLVLRLSELAAERDHLGQIERRRLLDAERLAIDARDLREVRVEAVQAPRAHPAP